jgi:hypothetical protein
VSFRIHKVRKSIEFRVSQIPNPTSKRAWIGKSKGINGASIPPIVWNQDKILLANQLAKKLIGSYITMKAEPRVAITDPERLTH